MIWKILYKYRFWLLVLIFFGPWLLAWFLFSYAPHVLGVKHTGLLLSPPYHLSQPVQDLLYANQNVSRRPPWLWVTFDSPHCDALCEDTVYKQYHQVHKALGKDAPRLRRLHLSLDAHPRRFAANVTLSESQLSKLQGLVKGSYISMLVDPRGFVVLVYNVHHTSKGILSDLKRLLKVSQIG